MSFAEVAGGYEEDSEDWDEDWPELPDDAADERIWIEPDVEWGRW
jgi:hypothetical protein